MLWQYVDMTETRTFQRYLLGSEDCCATYGNLRFGHEKSRLDTTPNGLFRLVRSPLSYQQKRLEAPRILPSVASFWPIFWIRVKRTLEQNSHFREWPAVLHTTANLGTGVQNCDRLPISLS